MSWPERSSFPCSWPGSPVSIAWRSGPGREWAQRALDSAREASASLGPLLYEGAPGNVAAPVWGEAGSVRGALAGETTVPWTSSRALGWDGPVPMVVTEGEAGPGVIDPMHRVPGSGDCVVMVDEGQTVEAPLDSPAEIRTWLVRLRARAVSGSDGTVTLAFPGGESVLAQLPPGGGYAYLALEGQGDRVEVRTARGGLCIQELLIGRGQLTG